MNIYLELDISVKMVTNIILVTIKWQRVPAFNI